MSSPLLRIPMNLQYKLKADLRNKLRDKRGRRPNVTGILSPIRLKAGIKSERPLAMLFQSH